MALDKLRAGKCTQDDYITINEYNVMLWTLGRQVAINRASEETGEVALLAKDASEKVAECLLAIGNRSIERGRFVATGDELNAIRESFDLADQFIKSIPKGLVLQAMMEAEGMVTKQLRSIGVNGKKEAQVTDVA